MKRIREFFSTPIGRSILEGIAMSLAAVAVILFFASVAPDPDASAFDRSTYIYRVTNQEGNSGGTGFAVQAPSGQVYLLTNKHVCSISTSGSVFATRKDGTTYYARILELSVKHDLCLIRLPPATPGLTVAREVKPGQSVFVLGHPLLEPHSLAKGNVVDSVTIQLLVGTNIDCEGEGQRKIDAGPMDRLFGVDTYCVQELKANPVTAATFPGNSGSPVLDRGLQVVGVIFAGLQGGGRGYMVPLSFVKEFLEGR